MNLMTRNNTNVLMPIFIQDMSSPFGAGLSGLTNSTAGLSCYYHRDIDTAPTVVPLANLTVGTYNASGFAPVSNTVAAGDYQFGVPNACWASSGNYTTITLAGANNMLPIKMRFFLTDAAVGYVATSGISSASYVKMAELSTVPTWPISLADGINWMTARSINKTITVSNANPSGGADVIYKQDNATTIGSGTWADDGTNFTRNKYA